VLERVEADWGSSGRNDSVDIGIGYDSVVATIDQAAGWSRSGEPPYAPVRRLPAAGAKLEVDPRMTESSETADTPAKPQDYAGLRAELATLANDFLPLINELWPRLEDHKYRWELHSYGLPDGYDKLVVADIIGLLIVIKRHLIAQCLTSRSAE
jgi:hypothetical protein